MNISHFKYDNISFIKRGIVKNRKKRISDIFIQILYKCRDENCTVPFDNIELDVFYHGFKIDHQNKTSPIYPNDQMFGRFLQYSIENQ